VKLTRRQAAQTSLRSRQQMPLFSGGDPEKEPLRPLVIRNQSWKQQTELENDFFFNTEVGGLLVIGKQRQLLVLLTYLQQKNSRCTVPAERSYSCWCCK